VATAGPPRIEDPNVPRRDKRMSLGQHLVELRKRLMIAALALVASQDGGFTVMAWSPCEGMVHAHRVETLLL